MAQIIKHKHCIIRAEIGSPPMQKDVEYVKQWFKELIEEIGMNILTGPFVEYLDKEGNRGMTGVCIIETSHIAMHIWDETNPGLMQLDVYTCGDLDVNKIFFKLKPFSPLKIEFKYLDRESNLKEVSAGEFKYDSIFKR